MPAARPEALLMADVRIKNPGTGLRMDLSLKDRTVLQVRASPDVLRLRLNLQRRYRATLALRTHFDGTLREALSLLHVEPITHPLEHASRTSWSITGLVSSYPHSVVVRGGRGSLQPFQISFKAASAFPPMPAVGESVRVKGVLEDRVLLATALEVITPLKPSLRERRRARWLEEFLAPPAVDEDIDL
jgi:hypothetical protein